MSDKIDDGGAAFPVIPPAYGDYGTIPSGFPFPDQGMSLRDYFAAAALHALCTRYPASPSMAEEAYAYADAMLRVRRPA